MAAIDNAYQYYLSTYGKSAVSRYDTHKKSQLRAVYNNMVKINKDSPLYKISDTGEVKKFAIDIKERARSIQNVIAALSDSGEGIESVFGKKIAQSSNEDLVTAEYIGQNTEAADTPEFEIEVKNLAAPQVNLGQYLIPDKYDIKPGSYSFDLATNLSSYEFQYSVSESDTNLDVQEKLIRLINNAGVGIRAELVENEKGKHAVRIESKQTGLSENENFLFQIMPSPDNGSIKVMRTLGIDNVSEMAKNSSFILNGMGRSSYSNTFTINNSFEVTLKNASDNGNAARIGFKADIDAITDNINSLVNVYNNIIQLSHNYENTQQSGKLLRDMEQVARDYYNELESMGLTLSDDGYISLDRNLLAGAVTDEDAGHCFSILNRFKDSLSEKASNVSIDPMNYVSKIIIAYKRPGHNFAAPYITSIYSGMMLDQYC